MHQVNTSEAALTEAPFDAIVLLFRTDHIPLIQFYRLKNAHNL